MKENKALPLFVGICMFVVSAGGGAVAQEAKNVSASIHGEVIAELLQVMNSTLVRSEIDQRQDQFNRSWLHGVEARVIVEGRVKEKLGIHLGLAGITRGGHPGIADGAAPNASGFNGLMHAYTSYDFGDIEEPLLHMEFGYFPVRYSRHRKTFGGYLYRAGTYPGYVLSGDDDASIAGLHLTGSRPGFLRHSLIVSSYVAYEPQYDVSISYVAEARIEEFVTIGAGLMFDRIFPVFESKTSPEKKLASDGYLDETGDTTWYTHKGIKLMGRLEFDFKSLLSTDKLGGNDLVLYTEAAILGVKDFAGYYDDITERVPIMLGLNLPTFKFLDVLSVEGEYYGSPHYNNPSSSPKPYNDYNIKRIPVNVDPGKYVAQNCDDKGTRDNYKWSAYAQKTFRDNLRLTVNVASDHFRGRTGIVPIGSEMLHGPDEWYWNLRLAFLF